MPHDKKVGIAWGTVAGGLIVAIVMLIGSRLLDAGYSRRARLVELQTKQATAEAKWSERWEANDRRVSEIYTSLGSLSDDLKSAVGELRGAIQLMGESRFDESDAEGMERRLRREISDLSRRVDRLEGTPPAVRDR